jgi:RNA polymerase sigma-70 factor (ECF subfamily)
MVPVNQFVARLRYRDRLSAARPKLFQLAYAWCHDPQLADDLVQEAYAKGLRNLDQLRSADRLEAWLCSILSNCYRDHFRRRREAVDVDELPLAGEGDPEHNAERESVVGQVREAIAQLSEDHRMVVTLVDLMECSYQEVAEVLDIPIGTVMSRLCRARARLRETLTQMRAAPETRPVLRRVK